MIKPNDILKRHLRITRRKLGYCGQMGRAVAQRFLYRGWPSADLALVGAHKLCHAVGLSVTWRDMIAV
jgi:hypothetical protein